MRTISTTGLNKLKTTHGIEPVCIVEIDWVPGKTTRYADKAVENVPGKITAVSNMDDVVNLSGAGGSQSVSITLDDVDGSIKNILDTHDVHKRTARVYQYFTGLPLTDKFLLFSGTVNTPVVWSERERTVKLTIISQLEDREIGFSTEEGKFTYIPASMMNQAWPMIFGTVINNKCVEVVTAITGTTLTPVGILAGTDLLNDLPGTDQSSFELSLYKMNAQLNFYKDLIEKFSSFYDQSLNAYRDILAGRNLSQYEIVLRDTAPTYAEDGASTEADAKRAAEIAHITELNAEALKERADYFKSLADKYEEIRDGYQGQYDSLTKNVIDQVGEYNARKECTALRRAYKIEQANTNGLGDNPMYILGGEDFPQNTEITICIEGGLFVGYFVGTAFYITSRSSAQLTAKALGAYNATLRDTDVCTLNTTMSGTWTDLQTKVPLDFKSKEKDWVTYGDPIQYTFTPSVSAIANREPIIQQFWAEPGAAAVLYTGSQKIYIVSITPGTVLSVRAFKTVASGITRLVDVPSSYYTVRSTVYGPVTAVELVLTQPLSWIMDEGWQDDIYVTFKSDIGPNIVDILSYIVDNYSDLSCDSTSFAHVRTRLEPFPANFPINDRRNVLTVLQEIAFQARCALWVTNGVVYLKYLPEEPASDDTITLSDIDSEQSVEIELTPTESLVTKLVAQWHLRYATMAGTTTTKSWNQNVSSTTSYDLAKDNTFCIVLRHNLKKYGLHEQTYDFYIYNQPDIVYKVATFWLIRKSTTWKRVKFTTMLHKLNLETFDTVYLDWLGVKGIVESALYDSQNNCIQFQCLLPVVAGTTVESPYFWPADLPRNVTWPPAGEDVGGYNSSAAGALAVGNTSTIKSTVFVGGTNIVFGPNSDRGDIYLMDTGFTARATVASNDYKTSSTVKKTLDLSTDHSETMAPMTVPFVPQTGTVEKPINLHTTPVTDGIRVGYLSDVLRLPVSTTVDEKAQYEETGVYVSSILCWDAFPMAYDGENLGLFDMKYDKDWKTFAAGSAFLRDDTKG